MIRPARLVFRPAVAVAVSALGLANPVSGQDLSVLVSTTGTSFSNVAVSNLVRQYNSTTGAAIGGTDITLGSGGGASSLTLSGSASSEGYLNLSADGRYLVVGGYSAAAGTASVANGTSARVVAEIGATGSVSYTTFTDSSFVNGAAGTNLRSVASDGAALWAAGQNSGTAGGVRYDPTFTATATTGVQTALNSRVVDVFDNRLFVTTSTAIQYYPNPTALPTTTATASSLMLTGLGNTLSSAYGFVFLDRQAGVGDAAVGGNLDTLYIADTAGVKKFEYDGTAWVGRNAVATGFNVASDLTTDNVGNLYSLTARAVGGTVEIYGTELISGTTGGNALYRVTDTAAFGNTGSFTTTFSVDAAAGSFYRGVDFTPVPEPATVLALGGGAVGLAGGVRRRLRKPSAATA